MELDQIAGLPAHPLIVHVPVVMIPLTLIAAVVAVAWPRARKAASLTALGTALVGFLGAQLATMSGEELEHQVVVTSLIHDHAELGEATRTLAFLTLIAAAVYAARVWAPSLRVTGSDRLRSLLAPRAVGAVLAIALVGAAVATTALAVQAGHQGAKAAWSDLPAQSASHDAN